VWDTFWAIFSHHHLVTLAQKKTFFARVQSKQGFGVKLFSEEV
jgi:hypothetical protein